VLALLSWPAGANAETRNFNIPAGQLGSVLVAFGEQARMTVGLSDPILAARRSPGAQGQFSRYQALKRILSGTGARYVNIDANTVRIVGLPEAKTRARKPPAPVRPAVPVQSFQSADIIVTASKQSTLLRDYAGTVSVLELNSPELTRESSRGTASIINRLPVLASTNLGPGRNKIFIRGIADSSFNGASPATVGQYLGDVRLTYNAPDPDLNLYDMQRVEVLEGPQGTLYGTGSLGGIIRLVPNPPDLAQNAGSLSIGAITVAHGGNGGDAAAMGNFVLVPDRVALRAVAFSTVEPGYIDDPLRGLSNINRTKSVGGRAAIEFRPGDDWRLTFGGAMQNIRSRDGQYALRGSPPLQRSSVIEQPFDNDYGLAYLTAKKNFGTAELTTTTSFVRHNVDSVFDATVDPSSSPRVFIEQLAIHLLSHETRLSGVSGHDSWVIGVSGLLARDRTRRMLGNPVSPTTITGVRNANSELAAFGQYSHPIASRLSATIGGRLSYAHSSGELTDVVDAEASEPNRSELRFSPTVALAWKIDDHFLAYAHAQSAFRPGLLEVAASGGSQVGERVDSDSLSMIEAGVRFGRRGIDRFSFNMSAAHERWADIQSDLIDDAGLPFTTNIGDGRITSFEAEASWRITSALTLDASLFLNNSRLAKPAPGFAAADERDLPNIARAGGRLAASFQRKLDTQTALTLDGAVRYVGHSELGIGAPLDVSQGNYLETLVGGRIARGGFGFSVDVTNLADVRGNRFSYGNPFGIELRNQVTPLVPRRLRLGLDVRF
jgi:outer membrane receptor protein involved in Fe transport